MAYKRKTPEWLQCLALYVSGDLGDLTLYTTKRGLIVAFPRTSPDKPPSAAQVLQRNRFRAAVLSWQASTPTDRSNYEAVTQRLKLPLTGQNLWLHFAFTHDDAARNTLQRQSGLNLTKPPEV